MVTGMPTTSADKPLLTPTQIKRFASDGFLVLRQVLPSAAVEELVTASDAVMKRTTNARRERKAGGTFDGFRNCITLHDQFLPLLTEPRVLAAVVQLMGVNIRLTTSQLIYRSPDDSGLMPSGRVPKWHRDMAPATEDLGHAATPLLQIKCAYYLTDCTRPGSGATLLVPNSNQAKSEPTVSEGKLDPDGAIEPRLQAGDCLLFENRTWHAGGANLSSEVRKVLILGYGYRWLRAHDFTSIPKSFAARLNECELFLMGESLPAPPGFRVGGGRNPIREWFDAN